MSLSGTQHSSQNSAWSFVLHGLSCYFNGQSRVISKVGFAEQLGLQLHPVDRAPTRAEQPRGRGQDGLRARIARRSVAGGRPGTPVNQRRLATLPLHVKARPCLAGRWSQQRVPVSLTNPYIASDRFLSWFLLARGLRGQQGVRFLHAVMKSEHRALQLMDQGNYQAQLSGAELPGFCFSAPDALTALAVT